MPSYHHTRSQWDACPPGAGDPVTQERIWTAILRTLRRRNHLQTARNLTVGILSAAAVLALGVFLGRRTQTPATEVHTTRWMIAENNAGVLPDGSKVWLEDGACLQFEADFPAGRTVSLTGNASFDVLRTEDAAPFVVSLPEASIEVHGTSFSVRQDTPGEISVALYSGQVDFVTSDKRVSLQPLQKLSYTTATAEISVQPFFKDISWQGGRYKLQELSIEELVDFIRWKYNVEVYVSPKAAAKTMKLTGVIAHDESVDSVVDKVCYVMGLHYRREGNAYRIFASK